MRWEYTMRALLIAALQTTLSLADAKAPQPVYILGGVVAPTVRSTTGEGQRSEPFAESEPAWAYAEMGGGLAYRECAGLLEHVHTLPPNL